jgi:quinol-cytochrome oxidoreductase complex cytochrome b subunit
LRIHWSFFFVFVAVCLFVNKVIFVVVVVVVCLFVVAFQHKQHKQCNNKYKNQVVKKMWWLLFMFCKVLLQRSCKSENIGSPRLQRQIDEQNIAFGFGWI